MIHCTNFLPLAIAEDSVLILNLQQICRDTQLDNDVEKIILKAQKPRKIHIF